ncbi:MAG: hypothetical protein IPI65_21555 [Bacteroidetes bacterium]|nr:hypothetical protein [Bacteroidota bacterium]
MKIRVFKTIILLTVASALIQGKCAQTDVIDSVFAGAIPAGKQCYIIGEVHLDQELPVQESINMIAQTAIAEDSLRKFLVTERGVNHFMLELPTCNGYFVREYINTGDETWIAFFKTNTYMYARIKNLRAQKLINNAVSITCVDINYPQDAERTLFALLTLAFYDHYSVVYYPPYNTVVAKPVSADLNIAISIMQTDTLNITPELRQFFTELIIILTQQSANATMVHNLITGTYSNAGLIKALQKFYATGWPEVKLIMDGYLAGFEYKTINSKMLTDRDSLLTSTINEIIKHTKGDTYCLQLGDIHSRTNDAQNDVKSNLESKLGLTTYSIHLMPQTFATRLQNIYHPDMPYDFNFTGIFKLRITNSDNCDMLILNR